MQPFGAQQASHQTQLVRLDALLDDQRQRPQPTDAMPKQRLVPPIVFGRQNQTAEVARCRQLMKVLADELDGSPIMDIEKPLHLAPQVLAQLGCATLWRCRGTYHTTKMTLS